MEDPFIYVESLDGRTVDYATRETKKFREKYGNAPEYLKEMVSGFHNSRRVENVRIEGRHHLISYVENGRYHVSLDGDDVYSTENVVLWIECDESCRRIAVFESPGSDAGILGIFENGEKTAEIQDKISSMLFTRDSYYIVKTYSNEKPPDGGELNSHRVLKDGKIVFGTGLKSNDFISLRRSGEKVSVDVGDWQRSETYMGELENPETWKRTRKSEYPAKTLGLRNGTVYTLEMKDFGVIKEGERMLLEASMPIEDAVLVDEGFLVLHLKDAKTLPVLYDLSGKKISEFDTGEPMGLDSADSDGHSALVNLRSFGIPYSLFKLEKGSFEKVSENRMLDVKIEEKWVQSKGARIHYFYLENSNGEKHKTLAYGYGGFNIALTPRFSPLFATLLKMGVSVAYSNLRGGGEYGEEWHRSGMRESKQNVFDDFISVIEDLKGKGSSVVAWGASNGGLLVSATVTQRPDLLSGGVIGNPVIDMMRFHRMSVGRYWVPEYGDPDDAKDAEYLMRYSPYHNVRNEKYPKILLYSRMKDDRVHPAHAIKFHMKMSEVNPETYLRINNDGGHVGITPREMVAETSDIARFVLDCLNIST